jgi:hypothetical protein
MYKIDKLLKLDQKLFHTQDLAVLWEITNKNTLYTVIKRYMAKGVLIPIYKGLYSTVSLSQLSPERLGVALIHKYTYLSCETILAREGIIFQSVYPLTFVSSSPQKFQVGNLFYSFRQMKPEFLFNQTGINNVNGILIATAERAIADMQYFNPRYYFDSVNRINWKAVKLIQKQVGYE